MIRASIHFATPEGATEGWLMDLATLPRIGDEIVLRTHHGDDLRRGPVVAVRHLVFGSEGQATAGAHQVEVDVDAS